MYQADYAHMEKRAEEKRRAVQMLEEIMSNIESEKRDPDEWENACLLDGIRGVFSGAYALATAEAVHAASPQEERSADFHPPERYTLAVLKRELSAACAEPLRPLPHFDFMF